MHFIYTVYMTVMDFKKVLTRGGWVGGDELYPGFLGVIVLTLQIPLGTRSFIY